MSRYYKKGEPGKKPTGKSVGRPRLELCEEHVYAMAQCGMTDYEIQSLLKISSDKLQQYRSTLQKGRANLSKSIKRVQLEEALENRNTTMLIWVGKQYAGQVDRKEVEHSGEVNGQQIVYYGNNSPKPWSEEIEVKEHVCINDKETK